MGISDFNCQWCLSLYKPYNEIYLRSVIMLYLQCFYSTAQTLVSDISISTKMDMYHYKIDTTKSSHVHVWDHSYSTTTSIQRVDENCAHDHSYYVKNTSVIRKLY